MDKQDIKNLKKRYLIWLYKTTKEAFDTYERKFTQLDMDKFILRELERGLRGAYLPHERKSLLRKVNQFRVYIGKKEKACLELRYKGKKINPEFLYLDMKLEAIEKIIIEELGGRALDEIKALYEKEMIERILKSAENRK
jgi:hypothetical protein